MRRFAALATGAVLLWAMPAAATQIQFLWEATGTDSITALPGQEVVLQVWVTVESPSITGVSVSALATPVLLEATGFEVCPLAPGNGSAGFCGSLLGAPFLPAGVGNIVLNEQNAGSPGGSFDPTPIPGLSGSFAAFQDPPFPGTAAGSFVLAEITYLVAGFGFAEVLPYYREGVDGAVEVGSTYLLPLADGADLTSGVSLRVIPEPSTAVCLALGLVGIGLARRRPRRA